MVVDTDAGWSSSVARRAHNPEVVGSNPAPATKRKGPDFDLGLFGLSTRSHGTSADKAKLLAYRAKRDPFHCVILPHTLMT